MRPENRRRFPPLKAERGRGRGVREGAGALLWAPPGHGAEGGERPGLPFWGSPPKPGGGRGGEGRAQPPPAPAGSGAEAGRAEGAARLPPPGSGTGPALPGPALPCPARPLRAPCGLGARPALTHLGVVVEVPEVQAPHPVHAGEERGVHGRPHDIVDIVGVVFKGVERLVVLWERREQP